MRLNLEYDVGIDIKRVLILIFLFFISCNVTFIEVRKLSEVKKEFNPDEWKRPVVEDFIKSIQKWKKPIGEKLYVIDREPLNAAERVMIASLQGIVAKSKPQIYLSFPSYERWLNEIGKKGVKIIKVNNYKELLKIFKNNINGYVLCPDDNYNVATFYAYKYNVIIVPESIEKKIKSFGIVKKYDVRDITEKDLIDEFYMDFARNGIITIEPQRDAMRDFAIANGLLYFYPINNQKLAEIGYKLVSDGVPLFGWGSPYDDEGADVIFAAQHGLFTIPADWTLNLTVLAGTEKLVNTKYKQKKYIEKIAAKRNVHYVTFMMSDGDNFNWFLDGVHRDEKYFMNKNRGKFPIGWMIPPLSRELAPIALNWYYKNATPNDYFLCALSGAGYTAPSKMPDNTLEKFVKLTGYEMEILDMNLLVILDHGDFYYKKETFKKFIENIPELKGILYMDYADYAGYKGATYFINNIPVVSFRYKLWKDVMPPDELINQLNNAKRDVSSIDSYSAVVVHAWSYGLDEVAYIIKNLDKDIRVVRPDSFFKLIRKNIRR